MRNFLIDTDTASDDAVAIMMALAEPNVRVLGLTTVAGNVGLEQATQNALLTAEVCNSDVPVFAGADKPLTRAHDHAHWFHGKDGLGDRGFPTPKRKQEREARRGRDPAAGAREAGPHTGDAWARSPISRLRSSAIPSSRSGSAAAW